MLCQRSRKRAVLVIYSLWCFLVPGLLWAQGNNNNNNNNNKGNTQNINFTTNGILIDTEGLVKPVVSRENQAHLNALRKVAIAEAKLNQPADLQKFSPLRKVSLVRLEQAWAKLPGGSAKWPEDILYLAGLQRIEYVILSPETKDLIIAGPAEGFVVDQLGKATGFTTNRSPLRLDDFLVALRALQRVGVIGCSIDPRQENSAKLQAALKNLEPATSVEQAVARHYELAKVLGTHDVRFINLAADTHYAQALLEADYRLKMISLGLENPPLKGFKSHLALTGAGSNSAQRFWFVPLYDTFSKSEDGKVIQFAGPRAQVLTQEELVKMDGTRIDVHTRHSTVKFAKQMTDRLPELAEAAPIYSELQNLIDWAILVALLKRQGWAQEIEWEMLAYLDEENRPVPKYPVPKTIAIQANHKIAGRNRVIGMVGGGVSIAPNQVFDNLKFNVESDGALGRVRQSGTAPASGNWWWD